MCLVIDSSGMPSKPRVTPVVCIQYLKTDATSVIPWITILGCCFPLIKRITNVVLTYEDILETLFPHKEEYIIEFLSLDQTCESDYSDRYSG